MPLPTETPSYYEMPPVVERVATVHAAMEEEHFEAKFDEWRDIVQAEFPVDESLKEWLITVEQKEGIPLLNTAKPELRITPRFSLKPSTEKFDWSIRCPIGQLTMNMHSAPGQGEDRRYHNLLAGYKRWLPLWLNHFGVKTIQSLSLHYVNTLSVETMPEFYTDAGRFGLDRVIVAFSQVPGEHEYIVPPYLSQANVKLKGREDSLLRLQLETTSKVKELPAAKLDIVAETKVTEESCSADAILDLLDWQHEKVIERFEAVFTEKAKESFKPVQI